MTLNVFNENGAAGLVQVSPNQLMKTLGLQEAMDASSFMGSSDSSMGMGNEVWAKLPSEKTMRDDEYKLVDGTWPKAYNEVVLAVDSNKEISDYTLYSLGLMDQEELAKNFKALQNKEEIEAGKQRSYTTKELLDMKFKLILNTDLYEKVNGIWASIKV